MKKTKILVLSIVLAVAAFAFVNLVDRTTVSAAAACGTSEVTESDVTRQVEGTPPTDDWVLYTRAGTPPTAAQFEDGPGTPPLGDGSLRLTTLTSGEKVFLFNFDHVGTKLNEIDNISYSTFRVAGSAQQVAALNVVIDFNGPAVADGFATLVFEPVYNTNQGSVISGQWQTWTATGSGNWWSTRAINGQCAGATAACDKTWAEIVANNPDATILGGVGFNQGSGNPGLVTNVDAFTFDCTTYDLEADTDNDGIGNGSDNCPTIANSDQADVDSDGIGDACDSDNDNDGVDDNVDNCPAVANTDQANNDADALGDVCDSDDDNDGVSDVNDAFPFDPSESVDTDNDGIGNNADTDDDGDGQSDADETACGSNPLNATSKSLDTDNDNSPNCVDADDDNDGINDGPDNCDLTPNPSQADFDGDGIGDACETGPVTPTSKDQCKDGGWMNWSPRFRNQGDCIQFVNTGR